ncbi:MAG TPA: serine hydrolase domain-containing protein [Mucilaginibacter sp.]|jgi:CubicO group peptidase (beta-lactamase class C family)|nr:serine hydrolase domain-containing protein [Mucilaginibacter sp.]
MIKKLLPVTTLLIAFAFACNGQTFNKAKLDSFFVALNTHNRNMGSIAISANGTLVYQNAIGYAEYNDQAKIPASVNTRYRIGSISKMFTAAMIFQLIQEGKLNLDMHLATWFPQLPNADKITIGEMLDHHSGLHNFTNDSLYAGYMGKPMTETAMLAMFAQDKPDFEPGEKGQYSNTNFVLLGYIIEKITDKPYAEELKQRITSPIGLANTYYGGKANINNNEAWSYQFSGQWTQQAETDMSIPGGAGAIVSTPADLDKFIEALFGGKLISSASLEEMKTMKDTFGMAMFIIPFYEKQGYGHNGGIDGFTSLLIYFPADKLAIAYTSNGAVSTTNDVIVGALSIYFNRPFTIPEFKTFALTSQDLDKYLGNYASTQMPLKVAITKNNATLMAQATGQGAFPLEAVAADKFVFSGAGVTILFNPAQNSFTLEQGGKSYVFTKEK